MALSPGNCLGPCQISAQIGVGGMGEEYRATDATLTRDGLTYCSRLMTRLLVVVAVAVGSAGWSCAAPTDQSEPAIAWVGGSWFDGDTFAQMDVYTVGEKLTLARPGDIVRTEDLSGQYVVPPLGEGHNHNIPGAPTEEAIQRYLGDGVLYTMIQGNVPRARAEVAALVNQPESLDVIFANGLFTAPGGHPSALVARNLALGTMTLEDAEGGFLHSVQSEADIERVWEDSINSQQPDFIKLVLVYSEDRQRLRPRPDTSDRHGLEPSLVPFIVSRAHRDGLRVSAHVESAVDFEVAVEAGVDIAAHLLGFWPDPERIAREGVEIYRIPNTTARLAGERGMAVMTTLGEALRELTANEALAPVGDALLDVYRHNLAILRRSGARIVIGSDQFGGSSVGDALAIYEAGLMDATSLLRALTIDAAGVIFPDRVVGLIDGARADFVVLRENPLLDFHAITSVQRVVKNGHEVTGDVPATAR